MHAYAPLHPRHLAQTQWVCLDICPDLGRSNRGVEYAGWKHHLFCTISKHRTSLRLYQCVGPANVDYVLYQTYAIYINNQRASAAQLVPFISQRRLSKLPGFQLRHVCDYLKYLRLRAGASCRFPRDQLCTDCGDKPSSRCGDFSRPQVVCFKDHHRRGSFQC